MKRNIFGIVLIFSLVIFSGCNFFSGKNSTNEEIKTDNKIENQQDAVVEDKVLPKAEAQNEPVVSKEADAVKNTTAPVIAQESAEAKLAKCMTEKGAKLYTASTCPHCKVQKELFKDGLKYLDNTECKAMDGWAQACIDNEINSVPTWIFADGQRLSGSTPLEALAAKTGCEYIPATSSAS
jgi:hypothetical protein